MFSKLKDKLKSWTKKVSERKEIDIPKQEFVEPPVKFNVGIQKFEPDLEKIENLPKPTEKSFLEKITSKVNKVKISEKELMLF